KEKGPAGWQGLSISGDDCSEFAVVPVAIVTEIGVGAHIVRAIGVLAGGDVVPVAGYVDPIIVGGARYGSTGGEAKNAGADGWAGAVVAMIIVVMIVPPPRPHLGACGGRSREGDPGCHCQRRTYSNESVHFSAPEPVSRSCNER